MLVEMYKNYFDWLTNIQSICTTVLLSQHLKKSQHHKLIYKFLVFKILLPIQIVTIKNVVNKLIFGGHFLYIAK